MAVTAIPNAPPNATPKSLPPMPAVPPPKNSRAASSVKFGRLSPKNVGYRIVLNAVEGFGKTSMAAFAKKPAIIMCKGETGYETLLAANRVPSVDAAGAGTWADMISLITQVDEAGTPYDVLAIDALGGAERLCHEIVCARDFHNDWGEKGFTAYQRGYEVALADWMDMLARLDRVRQRGTHILIISHAKVQTSKNPLGEDFDRYVADCHAKTWGLTHRWSDAVLFGTFITIVDKPKGKTKGKGVGGIDRVVYTEHRDAYDAKNRFGMPAEIEIPDNPKDVWQAVMQHIETKGA